MTGAVTVDVAGGQIGGAGRFVAELSGYLARTGRSDVSVIGAGRRVDPAWLLRREFAAPARGCGRRIALNNVGFVVPGGERWTLLRNALHFLSDGEASDLHPSLRAVAGRDAAVVRLTARWADVLVVPSAAMADRVTAILPTARGRIVVRPHPVSADPVPWPPADPVVGCPVLFAPYKHMSERLTELMTAIGDRDPPVRVWVTAARGSVPASLAADRRIDFVGELDPSTVRPLWARSRAIYFPTGLESFGYPLAEARVRGLPVIARDTAQNREIAGPALFGFAPGDPESLRGAVEGALTTDVAPDLDAFNPEAYFDWILGPAT